VKVTGLRAAPNPVAELTVTTSGPQSERKLGAGLTVQTSGPQPERKSGGEMRVKWE
jgi:hypothetical protein